ncbi:MAG: ATP-dependent 6-phosphofructokinase [Pirellulaceae bacterium]
MRIGVFCSGGDAPGMNACVRAVVRTALSLGHEVMGIRRGYQGLLEKQFHLNPAGQPWMTLRCVSDWVAHGGAFLHSSRSKVFRDTAGQKQAAAILKEAEIDALVPVGGDGTFRGAIALSKYWDGKIVCCPGTIDNDLLGTDYTIGFSTAVQTAVDAVDKIRDTAHSHDRMFLIEVMGRHSGYIAVYTAIASGAEMVAIPETTTDYRAIMDQLNALKHRGKNSIMMIVAEGDETGGAEILNDQLQQLGCPFDTRVVVLGHLQRGGAPTPEDRRRASQMGYGAVLALARGETGVMIGTQDDDCVSVPLEETFASHRPIPRHLLDMLERLAS